MYVCPKTCGERQFQLKKASHGRTLTVLSEALVDSISLDHLKPTTDLFTRTVKNL